MRRLLAIALLLAFPPAAPAGATDLELGVEAGAGYTSNVFSQVTDPRSDYLGHAGPRLRLMDEVGSFTWGVRYWPTYERYLDLGEADGWNHDLDARATWKLSPRTSVKLVERFVDTGDVNQIFTADRLPDPTVETGLEFGRDQLRQNSISLVLDHSLALRHDATVSIARHDSTFEREFQSESAVTTLSGSYLYTWDPLNRVGLSLTGTNQEVTSFGNEGRPTRYYNLSADWVHIFSPTLNLSASVGPTLVDQDRPPLPSTIPIARYPLFTTGRPIQASTCPRNGQGELFIGDACQPFGPEVVFLDPTPFFESVDAPRVGGAPATGEDLTYFANISLAKSWRNYTLTLAYTRDASTTSEVSGVVRDNLSAYLRWTPSPVWNVGLYTYYERRDLPTSSLGAQPLVAPGVVSGVPDVAEAVGFRIISQKRDLEVNDYYGGIFVNYALSRSTNLYFNFTYQYEELQSQFERLALEDSHWDRFYVSLGFSYTLPRFHLPF